MQKKVEEGSYSHRAKLNHVTVVDLCKVVESVHKTTDQTPSFLVRPADNYANHHAIFLSQAL
mgnify:CR=1 FL=1